MPTDERVLMTEEALKYCETLGMVDGYLLRQLVKSARAARALKEENEKLHEAIRKQASAARVLNSAATERSRLELIEAEKLRVLGLCFYAAILEDAGE